MSDLIERYSGYITEALHDSDRELYGDDGLKEAVARIAEQRDGAFDGEAFYAAFATVTSAKVGRVVPMAGRGIEMRWRSVEAAR